MTRPPGYRCVLCERHFTEYGHTAEPVALGRCCNRCLDRKVIPARVRAMRENLKAMEAEGKELGLLRNKSTEGG